MTDHTHIREAGLHFVDLETCVHRLYAHITTTPQVPAGGGWYYPAETTHHRAAQCPRPPSFRIDSYPTCDQHVVAVVTWMHQRGNPDVVVRRLV